MIKLILNVINIKDLKSQQLKYWFDDDVPYFL